LSSSISHAFRFVPGVGMHDLGTLGGNRSSAEAVNSEGTAVGWSTIPGGATRACLWTTVGDILDLNTLVDPALGWVLNVAYGINDEGQIVGYGRLQNVMRPFRLTLEPEEPAETDTTAPTINTMAATPSVLWPAHHQLVPVEVTVDATDDSGEAPVCQIASVLSSEPDNGLGDGDTASDIQLDGSLAVTLRAERSGRGPGRVYTIVVGCGDEAGNQAQGNVVVNVPRSRGQ
jgi:probable HAF family extracellular repeat protein